MARVLIVGAGGLGCPASLVLARQGHALTLVDPDVVDPTNLHRQVWYRSADVGRPKVEVAAARLQRAFPSVEVRAVQARVGAEDAVDLMGSHELTLDGTDAISAKLLLSDAAVLARRPLVYAGVLRMEGQVMAITPDGPCLRCLFEAPPREHDVPTCSQAGVLGSVAGLVGALQGLTALALLGGARSDPGVAMLRILDARRLRQRELRVRRAADCPACAPGAHPTLVQSEGATC